MLITIASARIMSQCFSITGKAAACSQQHSSSPHSQPCIVLTDTHNNQESSNEPAQLHYAIPTPGVHEVIVTRCSTAYPVRDGCDAVRCDYEEGKVVLKEGAAEDDEEEADGKDLR